MKKSSFWQAVKFTAFSISAGIIQAASFAILNEFIFTFEKGNEYGLSYFISLLLSVIWNFTFNRKFTFKSASNVPIAMLLVLAYYSVFTPLSIWWGIELTKIGWNEYLVFIFTMLTNFITEFLYQKYVVFKDGNSSAKDPYDIILKIVKEDF